MGMQENDACRESGRVVLIYKDNETPLKLGQLLCTRHVASDSSQ